MTEITPDHHSCETTQLSYQSWKLVITQLVPFRFELFNHDKLTFRGELQIINNSEAIDISPFIWRFRVKDGQIEQWCNVELLHKLSVGISYSFRHGALVIEYLARNSVPTRLDIRHQITQIDPDHRVNIDASEFLDNCAGWQRQYHDQPSSYLIEPGAKDFRESFSATQWVVLEENCEVLSHL